MQRTLKWAAAVWLLAAGAVWAQDAERGVIVTGEGSVTLAPDTATITLGVTERAPEASEAMTAVTGAVARIVAELDSLGIAARDRQTSRFYLRPVFGDQEPLRESGPAVVAYEGGNSVTVQVRDLTQVGAVLDGVLSVGANDFQGIAFELRDDTAALAEARKRAVADAMLRAETLADAANLNLGPVVRITEASRGPRPAQMEMAQMRSDMGAAIESGEITVRSDVTMVFEILPTQ